MSKVNDKAFTLVEILVIVGIIAILSAIAIPNVIRARINANETAAKATLKTIANALENYYAVNTEYPTDVNDLMGDVPPYLNKDYFSGIHHGFNFTASTTIATYTVSATPSNTNMGSTTYTITTGAVYQ